MKKYILLAGVALATMTASNVMAYDYSDVNVKANIEVLSHRSCTDLNFGTIKILPSANLANGAIDPWAKVVLATDGTVTTSGLTVDSQGYGIMGVTVASVANSFPTSLIFIITKTSSICSKSATGVMVPIFVNLFGPSSMLAIYPIKIP